LSHTVATLPVVRVELLYVDDCPGCEELRPRLRRLLAERGLAQSLELLRVSTPEQAKAQRFLGSPTVRVDDRDVDPEAERRTDFGVKCRLYPTAAGAAHAPSDELIVTALDRRPH
jgi:hypothetical protein